LVIQKSRVDRLGGVLLGLTLMSREREREKFIYELENKYHDDKYSSYIK